MSIPVDISHWWEKWFASRDQIARDRIIEHYSPLVKFVAGRVGAGLPSSVDPGDLVSAGVFGLIDAVERFDPERGVKFETFAVPRIRGAVFDGLRSLDWVPRSVRSRAREVESAFSELEARFGRAPSDDEISGHLKISATEFQKWLVAIASTTVGPLDRALVAGAEPRSLAGEPRASALVCSSIGSRGRERGASAGTTRSAPAARAREARDVAVLRRRSHPCRDRLGPRRHREPRLADTHQGGPAPSCPPGGLRHLLSSPAHPTPA